MVNKAEDAIPEQITEVITKNTLDTKQLLKNRRYKK